MAEVITRDLIGDFLAFLNSAPSASTREIADSLWVRETTAQYLLHRVQHFRVVYGREDQHILYPRAVKYIERRLSKTICRRCHGRRIVSEFLSSTRKYRHILKHKRLDPERAFDQYHATTDSMLARVCYLIGQHSVEGRRVLLLGDADFTSIGLALFGRPKEIVIFELHGELIQRLRELAARLSLPIKVIKHDLKRSLPRRWFHRFDTVFSDPPYKIGGLLTWLLRSTEALKVSGQGFLACPYHTHVEQSKAILWRIGDFLNIRGYAVTDMLHGFHTYEGQDLQRASMIRFEYVRDTELRKVKKGLYWWNPASIKVNRPKERRDARRLLEELSAVREPARQRALRFTRTRRFDGP